MEPKLLKDEHIEYLNTEVGIIVSPLHTFGTDAILLAHFANPKRKDKICDFGTGCGIIPMLFARDGCGAHIDGVELQEAGYQQFCRTIDMQEKVLQEKLFPHHMDLKIAEEVLEKGTYDCITMNPPYTPSGKGIVSQKEHEKTARHEVSCTFQDIFTSAKHLLRYGGKICICFRPERLAEAMEAMQKQNIEPKRMRLVAKNAESAPWLCLLEGRYGGKSGMMVEKNLFLYRKNGELTEEMLSIYGSYKEKGE